MSSFLRYPLAFCLVMQYAFVIPAHHTEKPPGPAKDGHKLLIAAAADLRFAMDSLVVLYKRSHPGLIIDVVYGSSGNFYEQISNGAPFDIFFSADMDYPNQLASRQKTLGPVKQYAKGRLVIWSRKVDPAAAGINSLTDTRIAHISIANPAHAPYGKKAVEVLNHYHLYEQLQGKLVLAENISQAAQFITSGAADIGIIALSLARSPAMQQAGGRYWLIPADAHQPLLQGYAILEHAKGNSDADEFAGYFGSQHALAILKYFGLDNQ